MMTHQARRQCQEDNVDVALPKGSGSTLHLSFKNNCEVMMGYRPQTTKEDVSLRAPTKWTIVDKEVPGRRRSSCTLDTTDTTVIDDLDDEDDDSTATNTDGAVTDHAVAEPHKKKKIPKPVCLRVLQITTHEEIVAAKKCLYKVYHEEQGWNPPQPNPSNLRIEGDDRFEDDIVGCEWIGLFNNKQMLVGVGRMVDGCETALYLSQEEKHRMMQAINPEGRLRMFELNRTAILPAYRGTLAFLTLLAAAGLFSRYLGYDILIGALHPKLVKIYVQRYGFYGTGVTMKYNKELDPYETEIGFGRTGLAGLWDLLWCNFCGVYSRFATL